MCVLHSCINEPIAGKFSLVINDVADTISANFARATDLNSGPNCAGEHQSARRQWPRRELTSDREPTEVFLEAAVARFSR
jgi:hypothetical protein